jgi:hypothetical protein
MLRPILVGVLLPIIAGLAIALIGGRIRAGNCPWLTRVGWEGALLLLSFAILEPALIGWLGFPPRNVQYWPPLLAIAALPLTISVPARARARWVHALLATLVVAGASVLLLLPGLTMHWSHGESAMWLGAVGCGWLATIIGWPRAAEAATPGAALTALVVAAGASALSVSLFGTFTYAQLVGLIAFPTAVVTVLAWWRGSSTAAAASLALALAVLLPMWWILAATMAQLPRWAPVLLALSGATGALAAHPRLQAWAPWKRIACIAALATVLVAPVLVWGVIQSIRMSASSDGY